MRDFLVNMKKRPIIIIFTALFTAVGCFAVQFNPFTKEFGSLERLFKTDYTQLLTDIAEWLKGRATDPSLLVTTIAIAVLSVLGVSIVGGLFTSGLSYIMYINTYNGIHRVAKKRKTGTLFGEGVNKRFWSMTGYIFVSIITLAVIVFLLAYLNMPMAISIGKVIAGDTSQILPMLLLIAVMVVVMFFVVVFYSMYVSYMMPSIIAFRRGAVRVAFKIVNSYCWYLIPRTLLFLVYNLGIEIALLALNYGLADQTLSIVVFAANFLLRTIGILYYTHYVFKTYIEMKEDMFDEA
ncbi:MAG: hypothetical protein J6112_04215 [Clostridia bacterium]|nr:hypothetical protein [Clostridia bacterium]MCR5693579.1 hypothetical protein [Clostridia bacterium]